MLRLSAGGRGRVVGRWRKGNRTEGSRVTRETRLSSWSATILRSGSSYAILSIKNLVGHSLGWVRLQFPIEPLANAGFQVLYFSAQAPELSPGHGDATGEAGEKDRPRACDHGTPLWKRTMEMLACLSSTSKFFFRKENLENWRCGRLLRDAGGGRASAPPYRRPNQDD